MELSPSVVDVHEVLRRPLPQFGQCRRQIARLHLNNRTAAPESLSLVSRHVPSNYSHALPTLERGGERLFFVGFHKNQSERPGPPTEHIDKRLLLGDKNSPGKSLRWPPKAVMTFRKRRVSHSRYNGNEIDDTLWISLVAVSSAIMKRVGTGGYKGLLPTEMNTLNSEVPGAPNYTEEGVSSMCFHEIDEPARPNQRPSDIGLATKHGLERSGLLLSCKVLRVGDL